jgi:hypothetical protein
MFDSYRENIVTTGDQSRSSSQEVTTAFNFISERTVLASPEELCYLQLLFGS